MCSDGLLMNTYVHRVSIIVMLQCISQWYSIFKILGKCFTVTSVNTWYWHSFMANSNCQSVFQINYTLCGRLTQAVRWTDDLQPKLCCGAWAGTIVVLWSYKNLRLWKSSHTQHVFTVHYCTNPAHQVCLCGGRKMTLEPNINELLPPEVGLDQNQQWWFYHG